MTQLLHYAVEIDLENVSRWYYTTQSVLTVKTNDGRIPKRFISLYGDDARFSTKVIVMKTLACC